MQCPVCGRAKSEVTQTRADAGSVIRRRRCLCGVTWTTEERLKRSTIRTTGRPTGGDTTGSPPVAQGQTELPVVFPALLIPDPDPIRLLPDPDPSKSNQEDPHYDEPPSLFDRLLGCFSREWERSYGARYVPTGGDRKQLGVLLADLDKDAIAELPRAFRNYLADMSQFVAQEMRHSLRYFCGTGGFNKYRVVAPAITTKEARTHSAGQQWEAMSNGTPKR